MFAFLTKTGLVAAAQAVAGAVSSVYNFRTRRLERQQAVDLQDAGAATQRDADSRNTVEAQRDQITEANERRPGDAQKRADKGTF